MIKIFATDLDGTLLFPKKKIRLIASRNRRYLQQVAAKGVRVVFVTGRNKRFCVKIARRLRIDCDFISDSGGRITIQNKTHKLALIPNEIALDISEAMQQAELRAVLAIATENSNIYSSAWTRGKLWEMFLKTYSLKDLFLSQWIHVTRRKYHHNIHHSPLVKMTIIFLSKHEQSVKTFMQAFEQKYAEQLEFNYGNNYLEITAYGCNKAHALFELIDYYGYSKEKVIVVGDEGNDYEMIRQFPNSFAMEQGSEVIKDVAKHVIKHISDVDAHVKL